MKRFLNALPAGLVPMVAATSVIVIGWSTWLATAPVSQHVAVSRALVGDVFARFGAIVGTYLKPCPSFLVATALSAQVMLPVSLVLFTSLFRASDLKRRLQCLFVGTSSLLLVPHMMGTAAVIYLVPTLATATAVSWACSLWVRATLMALPFCALVLWVTRNQATAWRRALVGSLTMAGLWLVRAVVFSDADLLQMSRPLVMSVSARDVMAGSALTCFGALLLVALPDLLKFGATRWTSIFPRATVVVAVAGGTFLSSGNALAYTKEGHFELTNGAYQILRLASASPATGPESALKVPGTCAAGTGLCGTTVSQSQWNEFLKDLDWTRRYLGSLPNSIPDTTATQSCATSGAEVDASKFQVTSSDEPASLNTSHRHLNADECRADGWVREGPQRKHVPTKCIAENHYGCLTDTECCTSGAMCVSNRCLVPIEIL